MKFEAQSLCPAEARIKRRGSTEAQDDPLTKLHRSRTKRPKAGSSCDQEIRFTIRLKFVLIALVFGGSAFSWSLGRSLLNEDQPTTTPAAQSFVHIRGALLETATNESSVHVQLSNATNAGPVLPIIEPSETSRNAAKLPIQLSSTSSLELPIEFVVDNFTTRGSNFDSTVSREHGIVISLYDRAIAMGVSLIRELRCVGNHELIQVYHCLPSELSSESKRLLLRVDNRLEIIDACSDYASRGLLTAESAKEFQNWWLKPLAVHHTTLQHVLLMDADDLLLSNPASVRHTTGYNATGALFFYDRAIKCSLYFNKRVVGASRRSYLLHLLDTFDYAAFNITHEAHAAASPSDRLQHSLAYTGKTCHEQDSSMVLIDKTRQGKAMDVLWWLITRERFRAEFSWGDKESFWLAFELARQPHAFSPWGVSVVSSSTSKDMETHSNTLCGSIAQFLPTSNNSSPELLYINGRALLDPFPQGVDHKGARHNVLHNVHPTHVTPRHTRRESSPSSLPQECLVGLGSTPLPPGFSRALLRRRILYNAVQLGVELSSSQCEFF